MKNAIFCALVVFASSLNIYASSGDQSQSNLKNEQTSASEVLKLIGEISDSDSVHTNLHKHKLEFKDNESGKSYYIVDSPELVKLHHENEKNYLVEIEAEKTSRFLFWGGNLIVKNFKVLNETVSVPHLQAVRVSLAEKEFGHRDVHVP